MWFDQEPDDGFKDRAVEAVVDLYPALDTMPSPFEAFRIVIDLAKKEGWLAETETDLVARFIKPPE